MGKAIFTLLMFAVLSSCSKDKDNITTIPTDGQYVGYTEYIDEHNTISNTFCLSIEDGLCTDFVIYNNAERFNYYQPADIRTNGSYPKYTYRINDFTVQANFSDTENFKANLSGVLCTHKEMDFGTTGEVYSTMALEATDVDFRLDNSPLDANGDGILDSKQ